MAYQVPFQLRRPELLQLNSFIDGQWKDSRSAKRFEVIDPGTAEPWAAVTDCEAVDVHAAVDAAQTAFRTYSKISPRVRSQLLLRWSNLIQEHKQDLATLITYETGKPIVESLGELDYAISSSYWFAGEADRIQGTCFNSSIPGKKVLTMKQPIGVVAALVPWNFPIAMVVRKAGAALAAGCTLVIKPSPETPVSILALMQLAAEAGFAKGVLNVLTTSLDNTPSVSEALCRHPFVKKVTFTGSTRVGKLIAKICSDGLKKVTLELGGNCPFIIFDDANLDQAADALMGLKWRNTGQACISANRVYVQSGVYEEFAALITRRTAALVVGHGGDSNTSLGPVTTPQSLDRVLDQVDDAKKQGAKLLLGGQRSTASKGFFIEPTIIGDATRSMKVSNEETFAPVLALFRFETEAEAVELANDTPDIDFIVVLAITARRVLRSHPMPMARYGPLSFDLPMHLLTNGAQMGLASYCFSKDLDRAWRLSDELEAGMIGLNTSSITGAEAPFGGMKESGYGKEAGKDVAVEEYLITKAISVAIESRL